MQLRIESPLDEATEALVTKVIGCAIEVHRRVGPGYGEPVYEDAIAVEFEFQGVQFKRQFPVVIQYRGRPLRPQRIDLIVEERVVVEIKAVERLHPVHRAQVMSYLRSTGLKIGLLINFNCPTLTGNIRRVVL